MGLKERVLDFVAKCVVPAMDHPARGGMTGDDGGDDAGESDATDPDENEPDDS